MEAMVSWIRKSLHPLPVSSPVTTGLGEDRMPDDVMRFRRTAPMFPALLALTVCLSGYTPAGAAPSKKKRPAAVVLSVPASEPVFIEKPSPVPVDFDALVADLEKKLAAATDAAEIRAELSGAIARRTSNRAALAEKPDKEHQMQLLAEFRRAIQLAPEQPDAWLAYLNFLLARPDQASVAAVEAQGALDALIPRLSGGLSTDWKNVVEQLEKLYMTYDMPLFRTQCLELLARGGDAGAASASKRLFIARETAVRRIPEVLSRLDASLSIGDLTQAQILLNGLQRLDPSLASLSAFRQRLQAAREAEDLLASAFRAMRDGRPALARDLCTQILRFDANNPQARSMLARLSTAGTATAAASAGEKVPRQNALTIELLEKLEAANQRDDILAARQTLRDLGALGVATPEHTARLQMIEQELLESRFLVSQRFDEAKSLFDARHWEKLRRLLNRNPALGNSTERVIRVWEMGLIADGELGWKDSDTLIAEADRLAEKAPKSFWPPYVKMRVAMSQGRYPDAEREFAAAQAIEPNSPFLTWPGRILWLWRHGWKFVPFLMLAVIFLLGRSMHVFFSWWERFYWTWIAFVARVFPGLALRSLEKRFSAARDTDDKLQLYRLLARCAFATGHAAKGVRYAELVLEIRPADQDAVGMLGRHYLKLSAQTPEQFAFVVRYAAGRLDDRELVEKIGKAVLAGRAVTPDVLPVLGRYMAHFPQDEAMGRVLAEYHRTADPLSLTAEAIDFLEKTWRKNGSEDVWYVLLRALMLRGLFDRFEQLVAGAAADGNAGEWWRLFDLADRQTESELHPIVTSLGGMDRQRAGDAMQRALALRFVSKRHFQQLAGALDGHVLSEDVGTRYHAQKARDHLRSQTMKTEAFVMAMSRLMPEPSSSPDAGAQPGPESAPAEWEPLPAEEPSVAVVEPVVAGEPVVVVEPAVSDAPGEESPSFVEEQPASDVSGEEAAGGDEPEARETAELPAMAYIEEPALPAIADVDENVDLFGDLDAVAEAPAAPSETGQTGGAADDGAEDLFADLPPFPAALNDEDPEQSPADVSSAPVDASAGAIGEDIGRLPDAPELSEITRLVETSTPGDIIYWKEYMSRPPSRDVLETLPKLLAWLHTPELIAICADLLASPLPRVRANAVEALEENGCREAIPLLITLFRDDDNRVKANAVKAMSAFDAETMLEELRGMIEDPRVEMRDSATYVLKGIRGQEAALLLEHLLRDGSPLVRFNAIRSMAVQGDPGNTQRLMEYLPEVADPEERDLLFKAIAQLQQQS